MLGAVTAGERRASWLAPITAAARGAWSALFAGDRRVWRASAVAAIPLVALMCGYCALPRAYDTGTNSVAFSSFLAQVKPGQALCVPGLALPGHTTRLRLQVRSQSRLRPPLHLSLLRGTRASLTTLPAVLRRGGRASAAVFAIPPIAGSAGVAASICLTADGPVSWGGTRLPTAPLLDPPRLEGAAVAGRIAVWYLPRFGAKRSYFSQAGAILARASLFRPGVVGPALYVLILLALLPCAALLAVRMLALAAQGRLPRRAGAWLYALAAVNLACWALISPAFQVPDEDDHFAYTQSLVERGESPSRDPQGPLRRWSTAETLGLEASGFFTQHFWPDTRPPWSPLQERGYRSVVARERPSAADGGGNETAATHGPVYYGALAPAYVSGGSSLFSQLTLMRLESALMGAVVALFTFLIGRELAPRRPWLAVLAALLVAYEPMYGFISGGVNNDVGVNACAAGLALVLIRILRRGITVPLGLLTGAALLVLPVIKGTGMSLYPVAALVLATALWREHDRSTLPGWAALAFGGLLVAELSGRLLDRLRPPSSAPSSVGTNANAVASALHHLPDYFAYLWQVFLPRLPFMRAHFPHSSHPAHDLAVSGWATFGWYIVSFPGWVYAVIIGAMLAALPLGLWAARRERRWLRCHRLEALAVVLIPVAVFLGFEAAYYSPHLARPVGEAGRYMFPALASLALIATGTLHAFGRRYAPLAGALLLVVMIALSYASQLLTLTTFYA